MIMTNKALSKKTKNTLNITCVQNNNNKYNTNQSETGKLDGFTGVIWTLVIPSMFS